MIIQIPVFKDGQWDTATGKRFAIEFDSDHIGKVTLARGTDHHGDGGMTQNDTRIVSFEFYDPEFAPRWVELPQ